MGATSRATLKFAEMAYIALTSDLTPDIWPDRWPLTFDSDLIHELTPVLTPDLNSGVIPVYYSQH
jgi:hypothetical protein